jgi:predicted membrane GTPase involved in stress response
MGQQLNTYDQDGKFIEGGKVTKITKITGLSYLELDKAFAGDIVSVAGFPNCKVTYTAVE